MLPCRANRAQPRRTTRPGACASFFGVFKPPCDRGGQQRHARRDEDAHEFGHALGKHHVDNPGRSPGLSLPGGHADVGGIAKTEPGGQDPRRRRRINLLISRPRRMGGSRIALPHSSPRREIRWPGPDRRPFKRLTLQGCRRRRPGGAPVPKPSQEDRTLPVGTVLSREASDDPVTRPKPLRRSRFP
jgi:hypothetical protein